MSCQKEFKAENTDVILKLESIGFKKKDIAELLNIPLPELQELPVCEKKHPQIQYLRKHIGM